MNVSIKTVDDYMSLQSEEVCVALENIRSLIQEIAPEAVEVISYSMPAYKYMGKMLIGFKASKNHCSLYTWNDHTVETFKAELKDFSTSVGTIRFTRDKPLPAQLVKNIVIARMKDNFDGKLKMSTL
ncbi:DUF1801 domain-containing protein [Dyadobacter sp. CY345]|uniref:iron chaperone n=1 Tax=Dyadobacter sp. CY345 TaxID=2909335 RepID=UPI001F339EB8|nr:DUF1801 domain-containing protein [Dyadobacter sp. CY345]MCF2446551.1 DUF1801 domain-containing protein [Dyadobacter sp. CY345]